jgi:hypothetical protein
VYSLFWEILATNVQGEQNLLGYDRGDQMVKNDNGDQMPSYLKAGGQMAGELSAKKAYTSRKLPEKL